MNLGGRYLFAALFLGAMAACRAPSGAPDRPLFADLPSDSTGVTFANELNEGPERNVLAYEYLYNGGGVAIGDVSGDGRPDLYFTANMGANKLYLNQGEFEFRDVTQQAGVVDRDGWTTGVTMADVNGDGRLDIYVCRSGWMDAETRRNKLYVNTGVADDGTPRFAERAAKYGLDDSSNSTHATFFDYDRDGDLDLYLLNHQTEYFIGRFDLDVARSKDDPRAGDKLYRNDNGAFVDVSAEAGIIGNALGYGLSATVSDINQDGWPDLYVANDYIEDDYLYVNQGDGTFREAVRSWLDHTSYSSMGADIADYNNDGRPDIYTLDMLAEGNRRQKLLKGPEDFRFYRDMLSRGYYHQYMRNMLHLSRGDSTFSEIGQLAGVSNTDWSWAALFADFDLDGLKDLYVTNGYRRDYTNLDYLNSELYGNPDFMKFMETGNEDYADLYALTQKMPSTPISNYVFRNEGDLTFKKKSAAWGLGREGFSNGAAYGDLDGDGDLDLVVNNINEEASVYRNRARELTENNYLKVRLRGEGGNRYGIGAKVELTAPDGRTFYQEMMPARGFQSAVEPVLTFGLGAAESVDLTVTWLDQTQERRTGVAANQTITLDQSEARPPDSGSDAKAPDPLWVRVDGARGLTFAHRENAFVDFEREPLLPHTLSRLGPAFAQGDVNGDGREDVFVGGARGQPPKLFVQQADGEFEQQPVGVFSVHRGYEDVAATFVDVNGDGTLDLYVVSGGNDSRNPTIYQDRVYVNDGTGNFRFGDAIVPTIESSGGAVAAHDYDGDGDQDLFVGGRVTPGAYPRAPRSYLLENKQGRLEDVTAQAAEALQRPGMVTDAIWADLSGDGRVELILAGEWMPIRVFEPQEDGTFTEVTGEMGLRGSSGWWYALQAHDFDGDGDLDLIAGNRGQNAQMKARLEEPTSIYVADFDRDGVAEPIMSHYLQGREYPVYWRDVLVEEIPPLEEAFPTYASYAEATTPEVLAALQAGDAQQLTAHTFATSVFENRDGEALRRWALPVETQFAPVRGLVIYDVNEDGLDDVVLAGNDFTVRPQWGRFDAGKGVVLLNRGDLRFEAVPSSTSGFTAPKDARDLGLVDTPQGPVAIVVNNNDSLGVFTTPATPSKVAVR